MGSKQGLDRRSFLKSAAAAACAPALGSLACGGHEKGLVSKVHSFQPSGYDYAKWDGIFRTITGGFIANALRTSDTFAVCDYSEGTMLDNFVTARGKTCDSVTRILPAIAAGIASPEADKQVTVDGRAYDLEEIFVSALAQATDPEGKDFWLYPPQDQWNQRQVESSGVTNRQKTGKPSSRMKRMSRQPPSRTHPATPRAWSEVTDSSPR